MKLQIHDAVAPSPSLKTNIGYMRVRYNVSNNYYCVITTALGLDFYLAIKENRCERVRYNETPLC